MSESKQLVLRFSTYIEGAERLAALVRERSRGVIVNVTHPTDDDPNMTIVASGPVVITAERFRLSRCGLIWSRLPEALLIEGYVSNFNESEIVFSPDPPANEVRYRSSGQRPGTTGTVAPDWSQGLSRVRTGPRHR